MPDRALIVVDMQNDFMVGGILGAPNSKSIVPKVNSYLRLFERLSLPVYATRDWHPPDHISFLSRGGPWPPHCVQGTTGAEFFKEIKFPSYIKVISKATQSNTEAYSGFQGTDLSDQLRRAGIKELYVCGIATEYCVKATVLDAIDSGFQVTLLTDAIAPIQEEDAEAALSEMLEHGCHVSNYESLSLSLSPKRTFSQIQ